jgi:hypothetical protein
MCFLRTANSLNLSRLALTKPKSCYFSCNQVGKNQLSFYVRRRKMSEQDEEISSYDPMPVQVVGLSIPDGSDTASLLVKDKMGRKVALQLDLEALLRAFEHVAHAMHTVAFNVTGSYVHVPVSSFQVSSFDQAVACSFSFGTIGIFCSKLSESQAQELGQKLLESVQRTSSASPQTTH